MMHLDEFKKEWRLRNHSIKKDNRFQPPPNIKAGMVTGTKIQRILWAEYFFLILNLLVLFFCLIRLFKSPETLLKSLAGIAVLLMVFISKISWKKIKTLSEVDLAEKTITANLAILHKYLRTLEKEKKAGFLLLPLLIGTLTPVLYAYFYPQLDLYSFVKEHPLRVILSMMLVVVLTLLTYAYTMIRPLHAIRQKLESMEAS